MKLWTWHSPDFSLLEGHVDVGRSRYADDDRIIKGYRRLAVEVGTDQTIWCYTSLDGCTRLNRPTGYRWDLDIPESEILCFVDLIVWNRIIGKVAIPKVLRDKWMTEAIAQFPNDPEAGGLHLREREDEFRTEQPPGGDWWEVLFVEPQASEDVSALVRHPVKPDYVKLNPLEAD